IYRSSSRALTRDSARRSKRASWSGKSERLDPAQLSLLLEMMLGQGGVEVRPDAEVEAKEDAALTEQIAAAEQGRDGTEEGDKERTRRARSTRGIEKKTHRVAVPESDRVCRHCGRTM